MADKGSKIVILDRQQYLLEANRQLLDTKYYKPIPESIQPDTQTKLRTIITSLHDNRQITAKQRDFLFGPDHPRPRHFYLLPKMHKDPQTWTVPFEVPHGRPIVSDCNSCSYIISRFIDHYLGPLSTRQPSYIKDTYHYLETIRPITIPTNAYLFTIDIESLDSKRSDTAIVQLLQICLTSKDFLFNHRHYLKIHGTAMGQRFALSYAHF